MESTKKGRVLVTGVAGFLGSSVAKQLLEQGYTVRGSVRDKSRAEKLAPLKKFPHQENLEIVEADLLKPEMWPAIVAGCDHVIHCASPVPMAEPKDESDIIKPALEGTKAVLSACVKNKHTVKSVVLTSSIAAILRMDEVKDFVYTEKDWALAEGNLPYNKAKTLAERAAWDIYRSQPSDGPRFRMAVVNPSLILGPTAITEKTFSTEMTRRLLVGEDIALDRCYNAVVDVEDTARAHVLAMEKPECDGQRYICSSNGYLLYEEIAEILGAEFGPLGYKIRWNVTKAGPSKGPPSWVGSRYIVDNSKIKKDLGMSFISPKESVIRMGYSLIEQGVVPDLRKKPSQH